MKIKGSEQVSAILVGNVLIIFLISLLFIFLLTTKEFGVHNVFVSYEAILYVAVGWSIHSRVRSVSLKSKGQIK